jgi:hypothetical protein
MTKSHEKSFDSMYICLYEGLRTSNICIFHYYFVYLIRRVLFCQIAFWLHEPQYTTMQVFANLVIAVLFTAYMIEFKPFFDRQYNNLQVVNEITYVIISYTVIAFTDFQPEVTVKLSCGWFMILVSIFNLIYPNLYLLAKAMWPDIKQAVLDFCKKKNENEEEEEANKDRVRLYFEGKRQELVKRYKIKLKEEFGEKKGFQLPTKMNAVVPIETIPQNKIMNIFEKRKEQYRASKTIKVSEISKKLSQAERK